MLTLTGLLTTTTALLKPGVGTLHLTTRRWQPARIHRIVFQPAGQTRRIPVPDSARDAILAADTLEQAMAALRRP